MDATDNLPFRRPAGLSGRRMSQQPQLNYIFDLQDYYVDGPRMEAGFRKHFYRADASQTQNSCEILVGHGNIFRFFALR